MICNTRVSIGETVRFPSPECEFSKLKLNPQPKLFVTRSVSPLKVVEPLQGVTEMGAVVSRSIIAVPLSALQTNCKEIGVEGARNPILNPLRLEPGWIAFEDVSRYAAN